MRIVVDNLPETCGNCVFIRKYSGMTGYACQLLNVDIPANLIDKINRLKNCPLIEFENLQSLPSFGYIINDIENNMKELELKF